jgi:hypothetical protein
MTHLRPDLPALDRIDTPALIVDAVALHSNIERMGRRPPPMRSDFNFASCKRVIDELSSFGPLR